MALPVKKSPFARASMRHFIGRSLTPVGVVIASAAFSFFGLQAADSASKPTAKPTPVVVSKNAVLWTDPGDISTRDLFYGIGGQQDEPHGPYQFVEEDLQGSNPKFVVTDGNGVKWKVKLGIESQPETVAARLVWAVGYYAPEDYLVGDLQVSGLPPHLHRGQKLLGPDGTFHNARLKREPKGDKKVGIWSWKNGPFTDTREWNGLRALMAVMNNWDLKDVNNAVVREGSRDIYMISDLGASFGTDGLAWPLYKSRGDLETYTESRFIVRTHGDLIDFASPARARFQFLVDPPQYIRRTHLEYLSRNVPRADARWIGQILAQLSVDQLHAAFRAAGYSAEEVDGFTRVVQERIAALTSL